MVGHQIEITPFSPAEEVRLLEETDTWILNEALEKWRRFYTFVCPCGAINGKKNLRSAPTFLTQGRNSVHAP
jgi:hypothetical protein